MRHSLIVLLFSVFSFSLSAQSSTEVEWSTLMDITFKDIYIESEDIYVYFPLFDEAQRKYDGQEIAVTGYMIPIDVDLNQYVLSAYPFSACFFCGNAGPESVMAIYFKDDTRVYKTDERITLSGTLELNDSDVDELVYVLRNAVPK